MEEASKKVIIIGGGIGGLGTACLLAKQGYDVELFEKNPNLGGRANIFHAEGFTFDMGPSWYLMPDIFEHFYELLGENIHDHLTLKKLGPSYRVFFPGDEEFPQLDIYSDLERDLPTLEKLEPGVSDKLRRYLDRSGEQYELAKSKFMFRNYNSPLDFLQKDFIKEGTRMNPLQTMERYLNKWFSDDRLKKILEYTLVFLGSAPSKTPALYNIMNYIDFAMGVYYPEGGIYSIIRSLEKLAEGYGAKLHKNQAVTKINVEKGTATGITLSEGTTIDADYVISNADMWFTETQLLEKQHRSLPQKFWNKVTMGPSAFILYLGLKDKVENIEHHNLRFGKNWKANFKEVFDDPKLPTDPSYYVCCPSKTDDSITPPNQDQLFVLVPVASGLGSSPEELQQYRDKIILMMEEDLGIKNLNDRIVYERMYTERDFATDYNAYKGTALGLAHTLKQTILRPKNTSKKVKNLLYVGAGTNPGIGMPICLISAELAYKRIAGITHPAPLTSLQTDDPTKA